MKFFRFLKNVFRSYDERDKFLTFLGVFFIFAMLIKRIVFPVGIFGFGSSSIYTEGLVSERGVQRINPLFTNLNQVDREISSLVFSGLLKYDPVTGGIVPDMATVSVNEDSTEFTVTLRQGLKWHDGLPVTIDDVYFTFSDVIMSFSFANPYVKSGFEGVRIELLDKNSLIFVLEKPNLYFLSNLTIGILPKHILGEVPPDQLYTHDFNRKPIGSGPYMITEPPVNLGSDRIQVTLERSPFYYGKISEIEYIRFKVYQTMEELYNDSSYVNGVVRISGPMIEKYKELKKFKMVSYRLPQFTAVYFNTDNVFLKEKNVRLALSKTLDKKKIADLFNDKQLINAPIPRFNENQALTTGFDPSSAKDLLEGASLTYKKEDKNKEGFRYDADGKPVELKLLAQQYDSGSEFEKEILTVVSELKTSWQLLGIDLKVELLTNDAFLTKVQAREYDILLIRQSLGLDDDLYPYWHSTQRTGMGLNFSKYLGFHIDKMLEQIRIEKDMAKRDKLLQEALIKIKDEVPVVYLYSPVFYYAMDNKVIGLNLKNMIYSKDRFYNIGDWQFNE